MSLRTVAAGLLAAFLATPAHAGDPPPMTFPLGDDPDHWVRLITWGQLWARGMEMNPGTTVLGNEREVDADFGIRRARGLTIAKPTDKTLFLFHLGINNQTFNNARKPQLYVHDLWAVQDVDDEGWLSVGAGLHYYNGVSRFANASTLNFLALDAPIANWMTIDRTDQFARQFGVFAKGTIGPVAYRTAVNKPFSTSQELVPGGRADYNPQATTWATAGYVEWQLHESESDLLPYKVGTYLGSKRVLNLGAGWSWHPHGAATLAADGRTLTEHDLLGLGADLFLDQPVGSQGAAITAYTGVWHYDLGPDAVRTIGVMNIGEGGVTVNGAGNAYPVLGTGTTSYTQAGVLLPGDLGGARLQPYATAQVSWLDALGEPMVAPEAGVNLLLQGHHNKVTLHWRNRPIYVAPLGGGAPTVGLRANEAIVQYAVFY